MTSDEFFIELERRHTDFPSGKKWDIIFIDGDHHGEQVYRDVQNSIRHLSKNGFIVLHDCAPPTIHHAREDYENYGTPAGALWNGTVWKAIQKLRQECESESGRKFNLFTVADDFGVGVIKMGQWGSKFPQFFNEFYEYNTFRERMKDVLDLKTPEQFLSMTNFLKEKLEDE
jgi:hypothetical protein